MSQELLERAQDQQAATAELLAELDQANATANEAVNRGDQTLKEAQETLKKLGGKYCRKRQGRKKGTVIQDAISSIVNIITITKTR